MRKKSFAKWSVSMALATAFTVFAGCAPDGDSGGTKPSPDEKPLTTTQRQLLERNELIAEEESRAKEFTFLNVAENEENTHKALDLFEVGFDLSVDFENGDMFSNYVVDIGAYIKTPSGNTEKAIAFYKQDASPKWAFRYCPEVKGEYTYYLKDEKNANVVSETKSVTITETDATYGKISVQGDRFVDSYGKQFTPVGTNYLDIPLEENAQYGEGNCFEAKIPLFKQEGNANLLRVWGEYHAGVFQLELAPGTYTECGVTQTYYGIGQYQLSNALNMDRLLEVCQENDVYLNLTLFNQWSFAANFGKNAYNKEVKGGMCTSTGGTTDFWTHEVALKWQEQLVRYYSARYSAYRSLGIFEWWNEVDSHASAMSDLATLKWVKRMDDLWDSINVNDVVTANSFAWKDHDAGSNPWASYGFVDNAQPHMYIQRGTDPVNDWLKTLSAIKDVYSGPVFYGEYSENDAEHFSQEILNDVPGSSDLYFMEGLWAPMFLGGAAGGGLYWKTAGAFTPSENGFRYMKTFADFTNAYADVLPSLEFRYNGVDTNHLQSGGYYGANAALIYVRDTAANDRNEMYKPNPSTNETALAPSYLTKNPRINQNVTTQVTGLATGEYEVSFVNIQTGERTQTTVTVSTGTVTLEFPTFVRGMAVAVKKI